MFASGFAGTDLLYLVLWHTTDTDLLLYLVLGDTDLDLFALDAQLLYMLHVSLRQLQTRQGFSQCYRTSSDQQVTTGIMV